MLDLGTWQALRDQGLGPADAVDAVSQLLAACVGQRTDQADFLER
jgi:hypothetical protein